MKARCGNCQKFSSYLSTMTQLLYGDCLDPRNQITSDLGKKGLRIVRHTEICNNHSMVNLKRAYSPFDEPMEYHQSVTEGAKFKGI